MNRHLWSNSKYLLAQKQSAFLGHHLCRLYDIFASDRICQDQTPESTQNLLLSYTSSLANDPLHGLAHLFAFAKSLLPSQTKPLKGFLNAVHFSTVQALRSDIFKYCLNLFKHVDVRELKPILAAKVFEFAVSVAKEEKGKGAGRLGVSLFQILEMFMVRFMEVDLKGASRGQPPLRLENGGRLLYFWNTKYKKINALL